MATLRNTRKLAAVSRELPENWKYKEQSVTKHTWSGNGSRIHLPGFWRDWKIEGRVTKKLSKEFSRTESRILGALSKLDEFLLNPQVRICSVAVPGISRNKHSEIRKPGTYWGSFPRGSLSQNGVLCLPHKSSTWFRAGRDSSQKNNIK